MNKRHTEYIALYLFVFGAILLFGVLARKFVLVKGYDEFSAAVGFFATVVVLSEFSVAVRMQLLMVFFRQKQLPCFISYWHFPMHPQRLCEARANPQYQCMSC